MDRQGAGPGIGEVEARGAQGQYGGRPAEAAAGGEGEGQGRGGGGSGHGDGVDEKVGRGDRVDDRAGRLGPGPEPSQEQEAGNDQRPPPGAGKTLNRFCF